jgi:hypothetical protein
LRIKIQNLYLKSTSKSKKSKSYQMKHQFHLLHENPIMALLTKLNLKSCSTHPDQEFQRAKAKEKRKFVRTAKNLKRISWKRLKNMIWRTINLWRKKTQRIPLQWPIYSIRPVQDQKMIIKISKISFKKVRTF